MHVAVAAHDFYPDPGSGGTGRYVAETAQRLVERGHRVSVVTRRRGDVPTRETVEGVEVYRYDLAVADRHLPAILSQLPRAAATVADHAAALAEPDVLSLQGPVTALLLGRVVDGAVPRVTTFHSPWPTEYRIRTRGEDGAAGTRRRLNVAARRRLEARLLSGSAGVVALSEFMRGTLRMVYGPDLDATVVPGGVDAGRFTPDGPASDRVAGDPAVLTVRRLSPRMGHDRLLRAFAAVREEVPGARLYVAGDGPLRGRLEDRAASLGVADATTFLGYVPDADLPGVYRAADLFVLPTVAMEGFGLATLEALASATPVVATPVGGTVEVLDGFDDDSAIPAPMLAPAADADALADCIGEWADLPPAARAAAGRACRRRVRERYTWERTAAAVEEYYRGVLSTAGHQ